MIWQKVSEGLPPNGEPVCVTITEKGEKPFVVFAYRHNDEWRSLITGGTMKDNVTHWVSIPRPAED